MRPFLFAPFNPIICHRLIYMTNTPESEIENMRNILSSAKVIAIAGASDKPSRASYGVMQFLQRKGYRCIPVNPRLAGSTVLDETVYPDLASIPMHIDMVDMFVNSELAGPLTDEAIAAGADAIWMQLEVINNAAAERAKKAGLQVVMDRCPAQEWGRLGLD
jgi:predicted CoA-binding protein